MTSLHYFLLLAVALVFAAAASVQSRCHGQESKQACLGDYNSLLQTSRYGLNQPGSETDGDSSDGDASDYPSQRAKSWLVKTPDQIAGKKMQARRFGTPPPWDEKEEEEITEKEKENLDLQQMRSGANMQSPPPGMDAVKAKQAVFSCAKGLACGAVAGMTCGMAGMVIGGAACNMGASAATASYKQDLRKAQSKDKMAPYINCTHKWVQNQTNIMNKPCVDMIYKSAFAKCNAFPFNSKKWKKCTKKIPAETGPKIKNICNKVASFTAGLHHCGYGKSKSDLDDILSKVETMGPSLGCNLLGMLLTKKYLLERVRKCNGKEEEKEEKESDEKEEEEEEENHEEEEEEHDEEKVEEKDEEKVEEQEEEQEEAEAEGNAEDSNGDSDDVEDFDE